MNPDKKNFYITTTIPYVNASPHIGFALELVQADALARYHRLLGQEVFFSTGTDEHGQKIWEASQKEGKSVQEYVDYYASKFKDLKSILNLSNDSFIRTTDEHHIKAVQEFWNLCDKKGDIYKKKYKGIYCIGCEKFITEKDLVDGKCEFHPTLSPEIVEEENYFFKITKYREELKAYILKENSILPGWRQKEALDFVTNSMEDFSISRTKERFSWGVPIPGDDTQVMYVWFDAFVNYISTFGWPLEKDKFEKFWQSGHTVQVAGKDMVKFQSVMWQGMLMSAGLKNTNNIIYHGHITGEGGIKMSKSIGNVINPQDVVNEYGTDALRYFLLREISTFEDSPFTMERFKDAYNANLANGLGNLVSRVMKMSEEHIKEKIDFKNIFIYPEFNNYLDNFQIVKAVDIIWQQVSALDKFIQTEMPFKIIKTDLEKGKQVIIDLVRVLYLISLMLNPILPETSQKIQELIRLNKKPETPLFVRK